MTAWKGHLWAFTLFGEDSTQTPLTTTKSWVATARYHPPPEILGPDSKASHPGCAAESRGSFKNTDLGSTSGDSDSLSLG